MEPITKEQVDALKAKYGKLFKVSLTGTDYIIRQLKRSEYKGVVESLSKDGGAIKPELHDEEVVRKGVVYPTITPEYLYDSAAGHIPTLAVQILEKSGFTVPTEVVEL